MVEQQAEEQVREVSVYVNRETGARATVANVNDSYADLIITNPNGRQSRFSMPIADYDGTSPNPERHFTSIWREAVPADMLVVATAGYRPPANAEVDDREADGAVISPELD